MGDHMNEKRALQLVMFCYNLEYDEEKTFDEVMEYWNSMKLYLPLYDLRRFKNENEPQEYVCVDQVKNWKNKNDVKESLPSLLGIVDKLYMNKLIYPPPPDPPPPKGYETNIYDLHNAIKDKEYVHLNFAYALLLVIVSSDDNEEHLPHELFTDTRGTVNNFEGVLKFVQSSSKFTNMENRGFFIELVKSLGCFTGEMAQFEKFETHFKTSEEMRDIVVFILYFYLLSKDQREIRWENVQYKWLRCSILFEGDDDLNLAQLFYRNFGQISRRENSGRALQILKTFFDVREPSFYCAEVVKNVGNEQMKERYKFFENNNDIRDDLHTANFSLLAEKEFKNEMDFCKHLNFCSTEEFNKMLLNAGNSYRESNRSASEEDLLKNDFFNPQKLSVEDETKTLKRVNDLAELLKRNHLKATKNLIYVDNASVEAQKPAEYLYKEREIELDELHIVLKDILAAHDIGIVHLRVYKCLTDENRPWGFFFSNDTNFEDYEKYFNKYIEATRGISLKGKNLNDHPAFFKFLKSIDLFDLGVIALSLIARKNLYLEKKDEVEKVYKDLLSRNDNYKHLGRFVEMTISLQENIEKEEVIKALDFAVEEVNYFSNQEHKTLDDLINRNGLSRVYYPFIVLKKGLDFYCYKEASQNLYKELTDETSVFIRLRGNRGIPPVYDVVVSDQDVRGFRTRYYDKSLNEFLNTDVGVDLKNKLCLEVLDVMLFLEKTKIEKWGVESKFRFQSEDFWVYESQNGIRGVDIPFLFVKSNGNCLPDEGDRPTVILTIFKNELILKCGKEFREACVKEYAKIDGCATIDSLISMADEIRSRI